MFESAFEKYRIIDKPIHANPIHAEEYASQMKWLGMKHLGAEETLRLISFRIARHIDTPENHAECSSCKVEELKVTW